MSNSFKALSDYNLHPTPNTSSVPGSPRACKRQAKIKIININCNSLILDNRYALLSSLLNDHDLEVLCLCDTNIDPSISNSAIFPPDSVYSVVNRKDHKLGLGGVLIAVKDTIVASPVTDLDSECEIL